MNLHYDVGQGTPEGLRYFLLLLLLLLLLRFLLLFIYAFVFFRLSFEGKMEDRNRKIRRLPGAVHHVTFYLRFWFRSG